MRCDAYQVKMCAKVKPTWPVGLVVVGSGVGCGRYLGDTNSHVWPCNTYILIKNLYAYKIITLKICKYICHCGTLVTLVPNDKGYPGSRPRDVVRNKQNKQKMLLILRRPRNGIQQYWCICQL